MQASQFCVGDWVMDTDHTFYTQVTYDMCIEDYEWEPVPLTIDMLKENKIFDNFTIDSNGNIILYYLFPVTINYVHEVQRLLRMFELKHLADNFKIDKAL